MKRSSKGTISLSVTQSRFGSVGGGAGFVAGAVVAGTEVAGALVVGLEVAGLEVAGLEVAGGRESGVRLAGVTLMEDEERVSGPEEAGSACSWAQAHKRRKTNTNKTGK